jgi:DNA replication protein DnaC
MADPTLIGPDLFNYPRPASFMEPESDEEVRRRVLTELVWNNVPNRLRDYSLRAEFKQLVTEFSWDMSWVLLGPTGSGKSTACVHLVRELLRRGKVNGGEDFERAKGIFWTRADAIAAAGEDKTGSGASKLLHRAEYSKLMILDDVAASSMRGDALTRVLARRYDKGRPVIVTSGALDAQGLTEMVGGEAIVRWLLDSSPKRRRGVILTAKVATRVNGVSPGYP